MQASDLVELSGLIAFSGRQIIRDPQPLSCSALQEYWSAAKLRSDSWARVLGRVRQPPPLTQRGWTQVHLVLNEIFTTEILTRVWTVVACEHDRRRGTTYVSPVVRSVLLGHSEARNQALNVVCEAYQQDRSDVLEINRLRSLSERWTDMLLAHLLSDCDVRHVAFDLNRVQDFGEDLCERLDASSRREAWRVLRASLTAAFQANNKRPAPHVDLNARIGRSLLACLRPEQVESTGPLSGLWMERLSHAADDTQALIEELIAVEFPPKRRSLASRICRHLGILS